MPAQRALGWGAAPDAQAAAHALFLRRLAALAETGPLPGGGDLDVPHPAPPPPLPPVLTGHVSSLLPY
jgi:hypothetical protein